VVYAQYQFESTNCQSPYAKARVIFASAERDTSRTLSLSDKKKQRFWLSWSPQTILGDWEIKIG
jgi:hypothetical protein